MITKTNNEKQTISPGFYTIGGIIVIRNTMTDTTFSISKKASSYGCIWIQSPNTVNFTSTPDIR